MKNLLYIIFIALLMPSCEAPIPPNDPPTAPELLSPLNNSLCISNEITFSYQSTDPDEDPLTYLLQISLDSEFFTVVQSQTISSTSTTFLLETGVLYFWRVQSIDSEDNSSSFSSVFSFYTEGDGAENYLPFSPELFYPGLNSVIKESKTTLEWKSNDLDSGDILSFRVYFGTDKTRIKDGNQEDLIDSSANPIIQNEIDRTKYSISDISLLPSTEYFWKIVVNDGNGGETIGQVWSFSTH